MMPYIKVKEKKLKYAMATYNNGTISLSLLKMALYFSIKALLDNFFLLIYGSYMAMSLIL